MKMPIRSIPPSHPNPPKRGSSSFSWGSSKAIGGKIRIGQVDIDLDQLSDISGLNELQARLAQTQGEPKGNEAKLQAGGKVSVLGHEVDLGDIARGSFGSISKARETFGERAVRKARAYKPGEKRRKEVKEPIVDILEEKGSVNLIIELPGIEDASQIRYKIDGRKFTLVTSAFAVRYRAEVELPHDPGKLTSKSLKNGIFLLCFAKKAKRERRKLKVK
jgi:HSP20 family molecular chaperone IbpA